jgi:hypothetical protein
MSRLLEQEHHAASAQLLKYSEGTFYARFRNYSTTASEVLEDLQLLSYKSARGLVRPKATGYLTWNGPI